MDGGRVGGVTSAQNQTTSASDSSDLGKLVGQWVDWSEAGDLLHVSVSKVRQMIRDHQLTAAVPFEGAGQKVPSLSLIHI